MNYELSLQTIMSSEKNTNYLDEKINIEDPGTISAIDEVPLWSAPFGMKLLETIQLKKNMNVLDIGFGLGFPMIEIAMRLGNSSRVYGIDPWEAAIERAKFKIEVCKVKNIEITTGTAEELPYKDNFFDLIVSNNGINNVEDINRTLSQCYRVSKNNAQFVFTMNLETTMIEFYNVFEKVLNSMGLNKEIIKLKEHIRDKRRPLNEIESMVIKSGYKIKRIIHDNFYLRYADGTAMLNHFLIKIGFLESWLEFLPDGKAQLIFDQIESNLNELAAKSGEIKLSVPFVTFDCEK